MDFIEFLEANSSPKPKPKSAAYIFGVVAGGLAVGITVITFPFIIPGFRRICLPYIPATTQQVQNIVEALKGRSGNVIDLGSGDGRVVMAAAKNGFHSTGIERNTWLVLYSRLVSVRAGLGHMTYFKKCNLWNFNLKPYNNIVIFGVESMMEDLEKKFVKELEVGTQIVACRFPLPNLKSVKVIGSGIDRVWVYVC